MDNLLSDNKNLGYEEDHETLKDTNGSVQFFGNQTDREMRRAALRQRNYQQEMTRANSATIPRRNQFRGERNSVLPGYGVGCK
jgi:hypothetical protein